MWYLTNCVSQRPVPLNKYSSRRDRFYPDQLVLSSGGLLINDQWHHMLLVWMFSVAWGQDINITSLSSSLIIILTHTSINQGILLTKTWLSKSWLGHQKYFIISYVWRYAVRHMRQVRAHVWWQDLFTSTQRWPTAVSLSPPSEDSRSHVKLIQELDGEVTKVSKN